MSGISGKGTRLAAAYVATRSEYVQLFLRASPFLSLTKVLQRSRRSSETLLNLISLIGLYASDEGIIQLEA